MGKQSKSRRERAQERSPATSAAPAPLSEPERLLAKYPVKPIADLPDEPKKFHLRVVTDILAGHDGATGPVGALWAAQTWHKHHDGLAGSRPSTLGFGAAELPLACAPGCNHCCRTPVAVVAAEAVLLAHVVARTFSPDDRLALEQRMADYRTARRDGARNPLCPLNVDGNCKVYEFRPYNCRMFHSFDADACERLIIDGEPNTRIPIDRIRKQFDGLIVASASVAFDALKLDTRTLELIPALEIALAADDRCRRLAAGDDLFAALPTISPDSPDPT